MYAVWLLGLGFGYGTERNIKQLYGELEKNYDPGDHVYIFGFSRGAFTARSLAGLIYRCGLLQRDHRGKIDEAYDMYRKHFEQAKSSKQLRERKREVDDFRQKVSHPLHRQIPDQPPTQAEDCSCHLVRSESGCVT
jgi:uncharacterized protein (DUF2235 family)